jgi:hypothetical protein
MGSPFAKPANVSVCHTAPSSATVAENDAESKAMAAFYRDRLVQKYLRQLLKAERFLDSGDYEANPKSMVAAGGVFVAAGREIARLAGAYLAHKVEVEATDPEAVLAKLTADAPAIMAKLARTLAE